MQIKGDIWKLGKDYRVFNFKMAFISIKKNLDERAKKKDFDEIFDKFDHNKNGKYSIT